MRRARATKGAEWSSRGVLRASRYCRQLVWGAGAGLAQAGPSLPCPEGLPTPVPLSSGATWFYSQGTCGWRKPQVEGPAWAPAGE